MREDLKATEIQVTREPDAVKVARPVRRGGVGKVLVSGCDISNSLASYPTQ
jgi:hypothetical protein